jgi:hypothetical protein
MKSKFLTILFCVACFESGFAAGRQIPRTAPSHPGNIFLTGEEVVVPVASSPGTPWHLVDYQGTELGSGTASDGKARLGTLPTGYYELVPDGTQSTNRISIGVLERLGSPTPTTSPIGIDVATAWFYPPQRMATVANLCALAGINWVRDRLSWPEMEPKKGTFSTANRYDDSAAAQSAAGLLVLQVMHISPDWANANTKRFPKDLRDVYNFERGMAKRWRGQVAAFEPWNEADIDVFGGHTGSEIASFQKAAYLGLKAGNPQVIACLNVLAIHRDSTLRDLHENEAWPFFDTFNLHHYEPFSNYPRLYANFRSISAGRPLWVTECSLPVKWQGDSRLQEPTPSDQRLQSERVAITYALALHEGAQAVFYFLLPHYVEGQTQFGILRPDLTPRPAFIALAAAGRLLADAKPLGRLETGNRSVHAYLFDARSDGKPARVLVAWADNETTFDLAGPPLRCFDHLGRVENASRTLHLSSAPKFLFIRSGVRLELIPPPAAPSRLDDKCCPIVLQAVMPDESVLLEKSAYKIPAKGQIEIPIGVYNFGSVRVRGHLETDLPGGWESELPQEIEISPGEREELRLILRHSKPAITLETVRVKAHFGATGQALVSFRLLPAK